MSGFDPRGQNRSGSAGTPQTGAGSAPARPSMPDDPRTPGQGQFQSRYPDTGYPPIEATARQNGPLRQEPVRLPPVAQSDHVRAEEQRARPCLAEQGEASADLGRTRRLPSGGTVTEYPDGSYSVTHTVAGKPLTTVVDPAGRARSVSTPETRYQAVVTPERVEGTAIRANGNRYVAGISRTGAEPARVYVEQQTRTYSGYAEHRPQLGRTDAGFVLPKVNSPIPGGEPLAIGVRGSYTDSPHSSARAVGVGVAVESRNFRIEVGAERDLHTDRAHDVGNDPSTRMSARAFFERKF